MEIRVVRTIEAIEALQPEWDALFAGCEHADIFVSHGWMLTSYRLSPNVEPLCVLLYNGDGKTLEGVFPFGVRDYTVKRMRFRALVHGASQRADYSRFLVAPKVNARLAFNRVIERLVELQRAGEWRLYAFEDLSHSDAHASLFREMLGRELYGGAVQTAITPRIRFALPYEEAKKISNVKRRFKKLADTRPLTIRVGEPYDEAELPRLAALHQQSYPGAFFGSPEGQRFVAAIAAQPALRASIEVSTIDDDGTLVAAHFGFRSGDALYYYVPVYDERYATYGPGQYLLWRMLVQCRERGLQRFDFLRGGEDYKFQWMNESSANYRYLGVDRESPRWLKALVKVLLMRATGESLA